MCRLLGITNFDYHRHEEVLRNFADLARRGNTLAEDPPGHADGWGLGFYRNGNAVLHRSARNILDEQERFISLCREAGTSPVLIAHLRKSAWPQTTTRENAHPFLKDNMLFAHNGTVRDYTALLRDIPPSLGLRAGALDTEVFFYYILSFFSGDLGAAFTRATENIKTHHTYSSLTSLFTDGKRLFAYREYSRYPEYYTLFRQAEGDASVVASEPVLPGTWHPVNKGELVIL